MLKRPLTRRYAPTSPRKRGEVMNSNAANHGAFTYGHPPSASGRNASSPFTVVRYS